ncbi:hypothetical protein ACHWQZ_G018053 [Mnemiopsis leidyi]
MSEVSSKISLVVLLILHLTSLLVLLPLPVQSTTVCTNGALRYSGTHNYYCQCYPGWGGLHCDKKKWYHHDADHLVQLEGTNLDNGAYGFNPSIRRDYVNHGPYQEYVDREPSRPTQHYVYPLGDSHSHQGYHVHHGSGTTVTKKVFHHRVYHPPSYQHHHYHHHGYNHHGNEHHVYHHHGYYHPSIQDNVNHGQSHQEYGYIHHGNPDYSQPRQQTVTYSYHHHPSPPIIHRTTYIQHHDHVYQHPFSYTYQPYHNNGPLYAYQHHLHQHSNAPIRAYHLIHSSYYGEGGCVFDWEIRQMCRNYDVLKCYKPTVVLLPSFYHLVRWKFLGTTIIVSELQFIRKKRKLLKKFKDTIEHVHLQSYCQPLLCSVNVEVQPADLRHEIITKKNNRVRALTAQDMAEIDGLTSTFYYAFLHSHGAICALSTDFTELEFYIFSTDMISRIVFIKIAAASVQRRLLGTSTVVKVRENDLPSGFWETEERIEMYTLSVVRNRELGRYYKEQQEIYFQPKISFENRGLFALERHDMVASTPSVSVLDNKQRPQMHRLAVKMDHSQAVTDLDVKEIIIKRKVSSIETRTWYDSVICSSCKFCGPKVFTDKITGKNFQISEVTAYNFCPGIKDEARIQKRQVVTMKNHKYCIHGLRGPYYWIMPFPNFFIVWGYDVFQNTPDFITFFNFFNQYIYTFTYPDPDLKIVYSINGLYPKPDSPPYRNLIFDYSREEAHQISSLDWKCT